MIKIRAIKTTLIGYIFLASVSLAYGAYFVCSTGIFSNSAADHSHNEVHQHSSEENDRHRHSHENESETANDDCCTDLTDSFLNDAKLLAKQLQVEFGTTVWLTINQQFHPSLNEVEVTKDVPRYVEPPPHAVHLRILNQTFII